MIPVAVLTGFLGSGKETRKNNCCYFPGRGLG